MTLRQRLWYALVGLLVAGFLVGAVLFIQSKQSSLPTAAADFERSRGPFNAVVQLIEYSDFQCPACKTAQPIISAILEQYQGKVRLVFQHFPLENHNWSPVAHQAAECAARQNKFWAYHDRLYGDQVFWSSRSSAPIETLVTYGKEVGLDLDTFSLCMGNKSVAQKIFEEKSAGIGLGIRSTPSFFVNGNLVIGHQNLKAEVEKQLQK